uniref:Major facilitator superfamily (MFS) profile domain-containing protein n=1 Tax=Lepeophtheirus salmonis TaxID=72036 RepID=A0A0K2TRV0_LEPSM
MISTCVVGGILGQHFGRRKSALFVTPIHILGFLLQIFASSSITVQFGRFLNGAAGGLTSGVVPVYISEISTNNYRTAFGAGVSAFYLLGTNFVFILGSLLEWRNVIGISIIFPIFGIITMMTIPDSPVWLITKDRKQEAREALLWLRGQHYSKVDEELKSIQSQYKEIMEKSRVNSEGKPNSKVIKFFQMFKRPDVYKPLLIVMTLMVLQQFCGMSAITYYAIKILIIAKSSIDKYAATVIFGVVRLTAQLAGVFLLARFARRTLFFTSALFMAIGTSMLGLGIYLNDETETSTTDIVGVLPILGISIAAAAYPIGLSPIPWSYTSELFPVDIRAEMCGLTNAFANCYIFFVVLSFPFIKEAIGGAYTFWIYSSVCIIVIIFSFYFLPETKGMKLEDISKSFAKDEKKKEDPKELDSLV